MKKLILIFLPLMLLAANVFAGELLTEEKLELIYKKIESIKQKGDEGTEEDILRDLKKEFIESPRRWELMDGVVKSYFDPSYITIGGGYDKENSIKSDDIYYEGQINAHLNWWNSDDNTESHRWRVYVPIRIQIRQFTTDSSPVKTPSFNPGLKLYYWRGNWGKSENDFSYTSIGIHHYSNGQSGSHYDSGTGLINTEDGSFSSDYLELSYYRVCDDPWLNWGKINFRQYITNKTWEEEQTDFYEKSLLELSGKKIFNPKLTFIKEVQLQLTVGHKFGRKYDSPGKRINSKDKFQYTAELSAKPKAWEDLSLYLRWDKGYDYYNINYQNKINRIQFGLIGHAF